MPAPSELHFAERETIVRGFPEAEPNELSIQLRIESRPEGADDIFPRGRLVAEIIDFQIQVLVLKGGDRLSSCLLQAAKIGQRPASFIERATNSRFG